MALLSLVFRTLGVRNRIGLLRLDATITETHDRTSTITDHPIEGGSFVQDHIHRAPRKLFIEGYSTDTPLNGSSFGVQGAYELLDLTWKSGIPFFVVSGLHVYPLMAFETLSMPKTREGAMRFSATMKELTFTKSSSVQVAGDQPTDSNLSDGNVSDTPAQANGVSSGQQPTSSTTTSAVESSGAGTGSGAGGGTGGSGSLLSRIF